MIVSRFFAPLLLLLLAAPALAENGVLQLPRPGASHDSETSQPAHPRADPVVAVDQVGSSSQARHHHESKHHGERKAHATPVVHSHGNPHAEKPAGTAATPAAAKRGPSATQADRHEATRHEAAPAKPPPPLDPHKGTVTGLPLPRFVALRSDEVNMRVGPGVRFPIEWQYHRRNLPVEILRELEVWRLVEDEDGTKGWVHQATLVGHRTFVVKGKEVVMRGSPHDTAGAVARLKPGVVGRIRACAAKSDWCEVAVDGYRGWLRREEFWGTFPGEAVN